MPLTTNIAESSNITQQRNSSSNISLHNLTVALNLTIQGYFRIFSLELIEKFKNLNQYIVVRETYE